MVAITAIMRKRVVLANTRPASGPTECGLQITLDQSGYSNAGRAARDVLGENQLYFSCQLLSV